ncbi:hypothetical protein [Pseudoduganella lutea]|uniref:Uncharacterized protein n=1 Tax=Pseudoduganella lutea TaxID=321985 RepID=A0A4P6L573_9BURK|nr:hypothetical protein [Pseudoduganella lutea]QBE66826.1 hypothetical protein EWM63_30850 [Pseudoduganella lutea]
MMLLKTDHLKAAALCAATKDIRFYLNGVFVEFLLEETRLVATDGNIAAVLRDEQKHTLDQCVSLIIPNDVIKRALTGWKSGGSSLESLNGGLWSLNSVVFTPMDGRFPDYRRIVPTKASGAVGQFDPELLAVFGKVAKALGQKTSAVHIWHSGTDAAAVQVLGRPEFTGVMMPLKKPKEAPVMSTWGAQWPAPIDQAA